MKPQTGTFRIFKSDKNGKWYWDLLAPNIDPDTKERAVILKCSQSHGFDSADEAKENAQMTSQTIVNQDRQCHEKFLGEDKQFYFRIKETDFELGVSEGYKTEQNRTKGIKSVMIHGKTRDIQIS